MKRLALCSIIVLSNSNICHAVDATDICLSMVRDAAKNVGLKTDSRSYLGTIYSNYCEQNGSVKSSSKSIGISILEIPASLTAGATDSETKVKNFCNNYQSMAAEETASLDYSSIVVSKSLDAANQCLAIAKNTNSTISYSILTPETVSIKFSIAPGMNLDLRGISHDASVSCVGSKIAEGGGPFTYSTGVGQMITAAAGSYNVKCDRKPAVEIGGIKHFSQTAIVVDTNGGGVDIYWPQDAILPLTTATQINSKMDDLNEKLEGLGRSVSLNSLPIGSLIPWFEKNKTPPKGWTKCDGSEITNCPDLRGLFLLGSSSDTVGDKGGSTNTAITVGGSNNAWPDGDGWSKNGGHYKASYNLDIPKPPYVSVLYIKKISE
ncbi:hypothetical protein [Methylobacterium sp. PvR107]|uniref:hypothetical protein n=1 Tax=Methylobacterium sp. PvR107 TaxID=2806597 RepID=UPI001AE38332|nr:hypothetical protein [Methylobacterium sp. PvR107]MBP1179994.1 hypothetical protein [Methylobacterium sp. PvR107]